MACDVALGEKLLETRFSGSDLSNYQYPQMLICSVFSICSKVLSIGCLHHNSSKLIQTECIKVQ